jgi:hypothetical protein
MPVEQAGPGELDGLVGAPAIPGPDDEDTAGRPEAGERQPGLGGHDWRVVIGAGLTLGTGEDWTVSVLGLTVAGAVETELVLGVLDTAGAGALVLVLVGLEGVLARLEPVLVELEPEPVGVEAAVVVVVVEPGDVAATAGAWVVAASAAAAAAVRARAAARAARCLTASRWRLALSARSAAAASAVLEIGAASAAALAVRAGSLPEASWT